MSVSCFLKVCYQKPRTAVVVKVCQTPVQGGSLARTRTHGGQVFDKPQGRKPRKNRRALQSRLI